MKKLGEKQITKHIKFKITTLSRVCDGCGEFLDVGSWIFSIGFRSPFTDLCTGCAQALSKAHCGSQMDVKKIRRGQSPLTELDLLELKDKQP